MIDEVQAKILESLNNTQNFEGKVVADNFDILSLSDFSKGIYSYLPLYTDEITNIIINFIKSIYTEGILAEMHIYEFINKRQLSCINKLVIGKDNSLQNLTSLSIWTNVLNKYMHNGIELYKEEEEYKNYLISYLSPNINTIQEEIKDNDIQAITMPAGSYYIRMKNHELVPTKETKEKHAKFLNY